MKATKEYLRKRNIDFENDVRWSQLTNLVGNNTGYLLTYTKFVFEQNIPFRRISQLHDLLNKHRNILSTLPKQVVQYDDYDELSSDFGLAIKSNAFNKFVQILTSEQKAFFPENLRIHQAASGIGMKAVKFFELPKATRKIFERTVARHRDENALIEAFKAFVDFNSDPNYNFNKVVTDLISAPNAYIRHIDPINQYVIARVTAFNTMHRFGKGTSWCIADYRDHFGNYGRKSDNGTQTIIIDFNFQKSHRLHRVGVTFNRRGNVSNMHVTGNGEIRPNRYFEEAPHINQDVFNRLGYTHNQGRWESENLVDTVIERKDLTISRDEMTKLIAWNGIEALIQQQQINTHKLCKAISNHTAFIETTFDELEQEPEKTEIAQTVKDNFVIALFSRFNENNKFIDNFNDLVHWLKPETAAKMADKGFRFKYSKHIKAIIDKYYINSQEVAIETKTEVQTINGRKYKVTINYEPIGQKSLNPQVLAQLLKNDSSQLGAKLYDQLINWAIRNNRTDVVVAIKQFHPEKSKIHPTRLEQYQENNGD